MSRDEFIRIAVESGILERIGLNEYAEHALIRFAHLVAEAEREACAKVCDDVDKQDLIGGEAELCAMIIRARGET